MVDADCYAGVPVAVAKSMADATAIAILGNMKASKGRQGPEAANDVSVCLGVVRLPLVRSDVVITLSTPTHIAQGSSVAVDTVLKDRSLGGHAPGLFESVFGSFSVHDWSLFGQT